MFVFSLLGYLCYEANEPVCLINATKIKEKFMHSLKLSNNKGFSGFAVFGVLIAFFAAGPNYVVLAIVAAVSAVIGYIVGKAMERDVVK